MLKTRFGLSVAFGVSLSIALLTPRRSEAFLNVGAEGGLVKRSADSPNNLKLGLGYGLHGELDMIPLLKVGPYYLHSELSSADSPALGAADAAFNTLGLRARLILPVPGSYKPYAYAGLGYTWVGYTPVGASTFPAQSGHFFETPLGVGIAYEVLAIFQLSLDVAYRPGFSFGGDAFDTLRVKQPASGWSLMLGAALDL
jgi:opacity protein-like surface antigen